MAFIGNTWVPDDNTGKLGIPARGAPAGMVWDPALGGYVSPADQSAVAAKKAQDDAAAAAAKASALHAGPIADAEAAAAAAAAARAQNEAATSAPGYISPAQQAQIEAARAQLAESSRAAQSMEALTAAGQKGSAAQAAASLAEATRAAQAGEALTAAQQALLAENQRGTLGLEQQKYGLEQSKFEAAKADRAAALDALSKLWGGSASPSGEIAGTSAAGDIPWSSSPTEGVPPTAGGFPAYDPSLDAAAYTGARQRVGHELSGSLKALQNVMNSRGLSGTPIEGHEIGGLVSTGMRDLADVNASMAEGRANRQFEWAKSLMPLNEQARQFNATQAEHTREYNQSAAAALQEQKLNAILKLYGMAY